VYVTCYNYNWTNLEVVLGVALEEDPEEDLEVDLANYQADDVAGVGADLLRAEVDVEPE
jgi:hypothetical protein